MKKSPRLRHKSAAAGCLLLAGLLSALPGAAQIPEYKIQSDKPHQDDQFGNAVAISGDYAIIGARRDDQAGKGAGLLTSSSGRAAIGVCRPSCLPEMRQR